MLDTRGQLLNKLTDTQLMLSCLSFKFLHNLYVEKVALKKHLFIFVWNNNAVTVLEFFKLLK